MGGQGAEVAQGGRKEEERDVEREERRWRGREGSVPFIRGAQWDVLPLVELGALSALHDPPPRLKIERQFLELQSSDCWLQTCLEFSPFVLKNSHHASVGSSEEQRLAAVWGGP